VNVRIIDPVTTQTVTVDGVTAEYRQVTVLIADADADTLADDKRAADFGGGVVIGDVARQVSDPVCDALIAAGYGTTP